MFDFGILYSKVALLVLFSTSYLVTFSLSVAQT